VNRKEVIADLRSFLELNPKFDDDTVCMNLPFLFVRDERHALDWLMHLELKYSVSFSDVDIDFFFFTDIDNIVNRIVFGKNSQ